MGSAAFCRAQPSLKLPNDLSGVWWGWARCKAALFKPQA